MPRAPRSSPRSTPPPFDLVVVDGWRQHAACHEHPTLPASTWDDTLVLDDDLPRETVQERTARVDTAKAACRACPVIEPCLRDVDLRYDEGVRGGEDLRDLRLGLSRVRWA